MRLASFSLPVMASVFSLAALTAQDAHADEPTAADVASARKLGFEGITLAEKGNCAAAVDKLARAEKLFHAPTTLVRLGECQVQLGKVVEGSENLGRAAREDLPSNAPAAFVAARARAKKGLAAATAKLAHAKVIVKAPPNVTVTVSVDSVTLPSANLGEDRALDPGPHLVEATAPGYLVASAAINLKEGGSEDVTLTLVVDPRAAAAKAPPPAETKAAPPPPPEGAPNRTVAYVLLGVGVVGVGVGSVFEVMLPAVTTPASVPIIIPEETPSGRGLRVLVVDDEPALARISEKSLARAGCMVRAVLDGASALDVLRADPQAVDVLVTDLTMPGMSGLDVAAEARRMRPDLPVLLVSGYSAMLTLESVQAEGIAAILQKPYTPDELALVPEALARG